MSAFVDRLSLTSVATLLKLSFHLIVAGHCCHGMYIYIIKYQLKLNHSDNSTEKETMITNINIILHAHAETHRIIVLCHKSYRSKSESIFERSKALVIHKLYPGCGT